MIQPLLYSRRNHRQAVFRVPSNMEIYLGIDSVGHSCLFVGGKDVKTPYDILYRSNHAVNGVAI